MKLYFRDQSRNLAKHLEQLKQLPLIPYEKKDLTEKSTSIEIASQRSLGDLDTSFLFRYDIFPMNAMSHLTQWHHEGRDIRLGDTIVQHVYIPPVRSFSKKLIVGVRVVEVVNKPNQRGFKYETIEGHIERGSASFMLSQESGSIRFVIHTFSKPNIWIARLVAPIFSVPYQTFLTRLALNNVKLRLASQMAAT